MSAGGISCVLELFLKTRCWHKQRLDMQGIAALKAPLPVVRGHLLCLLLPQSPAAAPKVPEV